MVERYKDRCRSYFLAFAVTGALHYFFSCQMPSESGIIKKIVEWKEKGYNTTALENQLSPRKKAEIEIRVLKDRIRLWKEKGGDTTALEQKLKLLKKRAFGDHRKTAGNTGRKKADLKNTYRLYKSAFLKNFYHSLVNIPKNARAAVRKQVRSEIREYKRELKSLAEDAGRVPVSVLESVRRLERTFTTSVLDAKNKALRDYRKTAEYVSGKKQYVKKIYRLPKAAVKSVYHSAVDVPENAGAAIRNHILSEIGEYKRELKNLKSDAGAMSVSALESFFVRTPAARQAYKLLNPLLKRVFSRKQHLEIVKSLSRSKKPRLADYVLMDQLQEIKHNLPRFKNKPGRTKNL